MNALFSIFVNLSIVWLKVASTCCPSDSICCNITCHIASGKFQHADRVKQITSYTVMKQPCSHDPLKRSYGHHSHRTHPPRAVGPDMSGNPKRPAAPLKPRLPPALSPLTSSPCLLLSLPILLSKVPLPVPLLVR